MLRTYYRVEDGHDRWLFQKTLRDIVHRRDAWLLRCWYERNRSLWTAVERAAIDLIGNAVGWSRIFYSLVQEMKAFRGQSTGEIADPGRMTINAGSAAGRACRALMVPATLLYSPLAEIE